jgi:large subunit ribosomal protein L19
MQSVYPFAQEIMSNQLILDSQITKDQKRTDIPEFESGTVVDVHYKITEGNKERIQVFSGIVIKRHGGNGLDATFSVLKNSTAGVKVTRTFPLHSPHIDKIVTSSPAQRGRRSKLYNLKQTKDPTKSVRAKPVKIKTAA